MVSNPSHYQSESGLEVIDIIEAFTSKLKGIQETDTGNILKYACRWNEKGTPILAFGTQEEYEILFEEE